VDDIRCFPCASFLIRYGDSRGVRVGHIYCSFL
jgi:hypothetical protein